MRFEMGDVGETHSNPTGFSNLLGLEFTQITRVISKPNTVGL